MQEIQLKDILSKTHDIKEKKVWYAVIIGRPNAGKSTFINTLLWEKIAITSSVPQTTRNKILAIFNSDTAQIIFIDTPWVHSSEKIFNTQINNQALTSIKDADIVLHFIDASRKNWQEEVFLEELLKKINTPVLRVYTKSDIKSLQDVSLSENTYLISSFQKKGFTELLLAIEEKLPVWPVLFSEDIATKQSLYFRISEIIREKLFEHLRDELPHSIFVSVEEIEETKEGLKKISSYIYTESDSQKYIIIWKNGSFLSEVWKEARLELEDFFDTKVFLSLRVKVKKHWRKDTELLKKMFQ